MVLIYVLNGSFIWQLTKNWPISPISTLLLDAYWGSKLAMRALKRATFYNILGFGSAIAGFCWWNQITCLQDLRRTVQSIKGVQISQEGSKPTKWEDIFPEESSKSEKWYISLASNTIIYWFSKTWNSISSRLKGTRKHGRCSRFSGRP